MTHMIKRCQMRQFDIPLVLQCFGPLQQSANGGRVDGGGGYVLPLSGHDEVGEGRWVSEQRRDGWISSLSHFWTPAARAPKLPNRLSDDNGPTQHAGYSQAGRLGCYRALCPPSNNCRKAVCTIVCSRFFSYSLVLSGGETPTVDCISTSEALNVFCFFNSLYNVTWFVFAKMIFPFICFTRQIRIFVRHQNFLM